jgi:DNA repair exonuclease SbcCD ATPase subunit
VIKLLSLRAAKFKQLDDVAIAFPQRGSVLIQGLNEAGKSTLFESIFFALFGKGLVTEENAGKLDDLIQYQSPRALVKLSFCTDDATFTVSRALNRGKPNTAVLDIEYAGRKPETVTNLSAVNRRIVEELRLDGDALLNSCFVEQKKLEKLEGMSAQQRRDTLLRLLNLEKLSALEAQYKPTSADELQLEQLRSRVKLAEVQRDLPLAEQRLAEIEAQQRVIAALRLQRQLAGELETIERERQAQVEQRAAAEQITAQLAEVDRLKELRDLARAAGEALRAIDEASAEIDQLAGDIARGEAHAAEAPRLEAEVARLEAQADELAELSRSRRVAELLRGWLQIREVAAIAQQGEHELGRLRAEAAELDVSAAECSRERKARRRAAAGAGIAALLALIAGLALGFAGVRAAFALLALAAGLGGWAWRGWRALRLLEQALIHIQDKAAALRTDILRREGEQALAQRTGQDPARLAAIEQELTVLGQSVPSSVADAHALLRAAETAPAGGDGPEQTEAQAREQAAAARAALQAARDAHAKANELRHALDTRLQRQAERKVELETRWTALIETCPGLEQGVEACRKLWRELGDRLAALDEPGLRRQADIARQQLGASEQRLQDGRRRVNQLQTELADLAVDEASRVAAEEALRAAASPGDQVPLDDVALALQQEQRQLLGRLASLRDQRFSLEQQLDLQGVALDSEEAVRDLAAFEEQIAVRKQAYRIVTFARKNIVGKVLPSTVRNMGLLLPLLTNDRYRDADIDPETYKIRVWDETARAMKAKDIFSGGTRDQFSLALRLAFALATLPEELGTAPGFIFLDEPLSSFDHQRGGALVDLLTRGPIAANFEQIFVISHNRSFDEALFDFHMHLDGGRIVETDLPPLPDQPAASGHTALALEELPSLAAEGMPGRAPSHAVAGRS